MCLFISIYLARLPVILGIVIILFFRCMGALLHPTHRARGGVRWGFVAYTITAFSSVTVLTGMMLNMKSVSYINNRNFAGSDGSPPGPSGYGISIRSKAIYILPNIMFVLNNSLADGVLVSFSLHPVPDT